MSDRFCKGCDGKYPDTEEFWYTRKDGYKECRECRAQAGKSYREANREAITEDLKARYRERIKAREEKRAAALRLQDLTKRKWCSKVPLPYGDGWHNELLCPCCKTNYLSVKVPQYGFKCHHCGIKGRTKIPKYPPKHPHELFKDHIHAMYQRKFRHARPHIPTLEPMPSVD